MKNIKEYFSLILFLIFSFSCSKFEKKDLKNGNNEKIKDKKEKYERYANRSLEILENFKID